MSMLSPRLQLKVSQKQILTPGLVQMVTVLQLNRLELKDMIVQEIAQNPVLEESADGGEELTPEEVQALLENERVSDPSDQSLLDALSNGVPAEVDGAGEAPEIVPLDLAEPVAFETVVDGAAGPPVVETPDLPEASADKDPFDEIDFGSFFDDYLDPGYKSPASESVEKPSFETFLSAPVTLGDHLHSQLSVSVLSDDIRDAAESIIGNLDEDGYLSASLEEIAGMGDHTMPEIEAALKVVQSLDPAGVGARNVRECLLLELESMNGRGGVAWQIVSDHLRLLEMRQYRELAKILARPMEHI